MSLADDGWETISIPKKPKAAPQGALPSSEAPADDGWETFAVPTHYETPQGPARIVNGMYEGDTFAANVADIPDAKPIYGTPQAAPVGTPNLMPGPMMDTDPFDRFEMNRRNAAEVNSLGRVIAQPLATSATAGVYGAEEAARADAAANEKLRNLELGYQAMRPWYDQTGRKADPLNPLGFITDPIKELLLGTAGTVVGSMQDPTTLIGGAGKTLFSTFGKGALANAGADFLTQQSNIANDIQVEDNPDAEHFDAQLGEFVTDGPAYKTREYDPVQTAGAALIGGILPASIEALNPEARRQVGDMIRSGLQRLRETRGAKPDEVPTPADVDEVMRSPEVQAILEANGIRASDPKAEAAAAKIEARLAQSRPAMTDNAREAPPQGDPRKVPFAQRAVSPKELAKETERQRALQEGIAAGEVDPAFAPQTSRELPEAFAVDPFGTARPTAVRPEGVPYRPRTAAEEPDQALEAATQLRTGKYNLPAVVERQPESMTDDAVSIAQRQMQQPDALPETPSKLYGADGRQPTDVTGLEAQDRAAEAFTLADRQRERLKASERPGDVRDTQAAGLERGVEPVEVKLDQGNPVKVLGTEYARQGKKVVELSRVRRYDPRTDQFEADGIEYLVPTHELKSGKYTPEPRRAQEFVDRAKGPTTPERPRTATGPVRREPEQTFRATEKDPNTEFPAAGEGRSPLPPQPEPQKPRYSTYEDLARDYEARQKQKRAEDTAREDRAKQSYKGAKSTNTPKGQDADGRWHIDSDGHVLSDKGGPVKFADQKQAARWILHAQKQSPDQNFEIVNHPTGGFSARETSRTAKQGAPNEKPQGDRTAQQPREDANAQPKETLQLDDGAGGGRRADAGSRADDGAVDGRGQGGDRGAREGGAREDEPDAKPGSAEAAGRDTADAGEPEVNARQGDDEPVRAREADDVPEEAAETPREADAEAGREEPREAARAEEAGEVDLDRGFSAQEAADLLYRNNGNAEKIFGRLRELDDGPARSIAHEIYYHATGKRMKKKDASIDDVEKAFEKLFDQGFPMNDTLKAARRAAQGKAPEPKAKTAADVVDDFLDTLHAANDRDKAKAAVKQMHDMQEAHVEELARRYGVDTAGMRKDDMLDAIKDAIKAGVDALTSKELASRASKDAKIFRSAGALTEEESKALFKRVGELLFGDKGERARHQAGMTQIFGKGPKTGDALKRFWKGTTALYRTMFYTSHGNVMAISKAMKSPTMKKIADMFHAEAGATDRAITETYEEAVGQRVTEKMNEVSRVLEPFFASPEQLEQITRMVQAGTGDPKTPMGKAAVKLREMLKEEHAYLTKAGVEIGEVKRGYFPREFDRQAIMADPEAFTKAAAGEYRKLGDDAKTALARAEALADTVLLGGDGAGVFRGTATDRPAFTAGRAFEKGADSRMGNFYIKDPVEVLSSYFMRSAKRAEAARRFGDKWEKWADMEAAVRKEVGGRDGETAVNAARALAMSSTGMRSKSLNPYMVTASEWLRAATSMALLERVTISSLQELVMGGVRSGNVLDGFKSAVMTAGEIGGMISGSKSKTLDMAEDMGIIYSKIGTAMQTARFSGDDIGSVFLQRAQRNYFRAVGLEQLTAATRGVTATSAQVLLRRLTKDLDATLNKRALRELGIPDTKQAEFKKWLESFEDGMPGASDIHGARKKGVEAASFYRTAMYRFVNQSVMAPTAATKPSWATHPLGALVFQLNGFNYAFTKNVIWRNAKRLKQAVTDDELTGIERAKLVTNTILPLAMLGAVGFGISAARDEVWSKHKRKPTAADKEHVGSDLGLDTGVETGDFKQVVRHASRIGAFGGADPWVNFFTQARYENNPAAALTGPMAGSVISLVEIVPELAWRNSKGTNTTERKFWTLVYDNFLEPAANLAVNSLSPANLLTATAVQAAGEGTLREEFVSSMAGEDQRNMTRREKSKLRREQKREKHRDRRAEVEMPKLDMFASADTAPETKSPIAATRVVERNGKKYTITKHADGTTSARRNA